MITKIILNVDGGGGSMQNSQVPAMITSCTASLWV